MPEAGDLLWQANALLHPGVEDFGMMVVEAQACGTPVIAGAVGGPLDSVDPARSGVLVGSDLVTEWAAVLRDVVDPAGPETRGLAVSFGLPAFAKRIEQLTGKRG